MRTFEALMNTLSPFRTINCSGDEALQWTKMQLSQAGLRAMQTFDLHTARHSLEDCPCPHHGTDQCDCQMVVLLVYANAAEPVTLILHGNDGQTWLSLVEHADRPASKDAIVAIRQALEIQTSTGI